MLSPDLNSVSRYSRSRGPFTTRIISLSCSVIQISLVPPSLYFTTSNVPAGVVDAKNLNVEVLFLLKRDGSLEVDPKVLNRGGHPLFQIAAENALRAVRTCAPFTFLPVAKYETWREWEVNFNPLEMFGG